MSQLIITSVQSFNFFTSTFKSSFLYNQHIFLKQFHPHCVQVLINLLLSLSVILPSRSHIPRSILYLLIHLNFEQYRQHVKCSVFFCFFISRRFDYFVSMFSIGFIMLVITYLYDFSFTSNVDLKCSRNILNIAL